MAKASGSFRIPCGPYADKTLEEMQAANPQYLLWLAGTTTKVSLKTDPKGEKYTQLCKDQPQLIHAAKEWIRDKCHVCWQNYTDDTKRTHFCKGMRHTDFYHYHPYGARR